MEKLRSNLSVRGFDHSRERNPHEKKENLAFTFYVRFYKSWKFLKHMGQVRLSYQWIFASVLKIIIIV